MAGKSVLWLRSIPSTKPDIRRSRPPIQKKNHNIPATFHTAWALRYKSLPTRNYRSFDERFCQALLEGESAVDAHEQTSATMAMSG
jgi:hypothetical protein